MKHDLNKPMSKGAHRFLDAVYKAFTAALCERSFEEITVAQICEAVGYPRATFYNYFDDKYDLMNFFWQALSIQVNFDEYRIYKVSEILDVYFERLYNLFDEYHKIIVEILKKNPTDGYFLASCRIFLSARIRSVLDCMMPEGEIPVSRDLLAEHYANTLLLVFGRRFAGDDCKMTKSEMKATLVYLLNLPEIG